jgi:hypothetical protein
MTNLVPIRSNSVGLPGDIPGMFSIDSSYLYYCIDNYDGKSLIWRKFQAGIILPLPAPIVTSYQTGTNLARPIIKGTGVNGTKIKVFVDGGQDTISNLPLPEVVNGMWEYTIKNDLLTGSRNITATATWTNIESAKSPTFVVPGPDANFPRIGVSVSYSQKNREAEEFASVKWNTFNATSLTANGSVLSLNGNKSLSPRNQSGWAGQIEFIATGASGTTNKILTIRGLSGGGKK